MSISSLKINKIEDINNLPATIAQMRATRVDLEGTEPIELFVDGSCESNPGRMGVGIHARQGKLCLFAQGFRAGHGTCNEAEHVALKTGLAIMQELYPLPADAQVVQNADGTYLAVAADGQPLPKLIIYTDSQLVELQVNGSWYARNNTMRAYAQHSRRLRKLYPYTLVRILRAENFVADSLAQDIAIKGSGQCIPIDNGRFHTAKQTLAQEQKLDPYVALVNENVRVFLRERNVNPEMQVLRRYIHEKRYEDIQAMVGLVQNKIETLFREIPSSNSIVIEWIGKTFTRIQQGLHGILEALSHRNDGQMQNLVDELTGADGSNAMYEYQLGFLTATEQSDHLDLHTGEDEDQW